MHALVPGLAACSATPRCPVLHAGGDDVSLAELRQHKLAFSKAAGADAMARRDDLDDYVVVDPLLERAKGKFSQAAQKERRKGTEWAAKARG
jgi:peptidyl-prolyl cis-trans isomerase SDCCAG10